MTTSASTPATTASTPATSVTDIASAVSATIAQRDQGLRSAGRLHQKWADELDAALVMAPPGAHLAAVREVRNDLRRLSRPEET